MTLAAVLLLMLIGTCAGAFGALAGVGGGIIVTPLLAIYFGLPMHQAIGVTLLCVIATSTATSSLYVERHVTDVRLGMTLELATTVGALIAALAAHHVNRRTLAVLFACFLLYSAGSMIKKAWHSRNEKRGVDSGLHPAELSTGAGGVIDRGRILRASRNWRRPYQSACDAPVYEDPIARGRSHQQLYDRRDGRHQRIHLLGPRQRPHRYCGAAGRRRLCRIASGGARLAQGALILRFDIADRPYRLALRTDDLQIADRRLSMSRQDLAADRILSLTLKAGAYTSFALIVAGILLQWITPWGFQVVTAGLLVLLATPAVRIVMAGIQFFRERDLKYALVSLGVLSIVVLAYFLGIKA
jgi:uncharacterized membrane protein